MQDAWGPFCQSFYLNCLRSTSCSWKSKLILVWGLSGLVGPLWRETFWDEKRKEVYLQLFLFARRASTEALKATWPNFTQIVQIFCSALSTRFSFNLWKFYVSQTFCFFFISFFLFFCFSIYRVFFLTGPTLKITSFFR